MLHQCVSHTVTLDYSNDPDLRGSWRRGRPCRRECYSGISCCPRSLWRCRRMHHRPADLTPDTDRSYPRAGPVDNSPYCLRVCETGFTLWYTDIIKLFKNTKISNLKLKSSQFFVLSVYKTRHFDSYIMK